MKLFHQPLSWLAENNVSFCDPLLSRWSSIKPPLPNNRYWVAHHPADKARMKLHNKKQLDCEKCSMRCSTLGRDLHDNFLAASLAQSRLEAGPVGPDGLKNNNRQAD